jgi:hypothetical protein
MLPLLHELTHLLDIFELANDHNYIIRIHVPINVHQFYMG